MDIKKRLSQLEQKAQAEGQFAVSATAFQLLAQPNSLDNQINLIGALHELGTLPNSLAPFWKALRNDEAAWIARCLARLLSADADYWALAALLGCGGQAVLARAKSLGFTPLATQRHQRYDKPDLQLQTLFLGHTGRVLHPLLEVGHDSKTEAVVDIARARSLILHNQHWQPGQVAGAGSLSCFMRATLPHGAWRLRTAEFQLDANQQPT
ncbi:MAG: hypothetical protein ABWY06_02445 [Pseudomonas sp.]|uniref:hypothetical protein n=1 Tax=Pseudomonas sp. TaxID=306 RepID=UPI0033931999